MELILVRHGLPERSAESSDPPLSAEGHEQARRVALALRRDPIDAVFASTMRRAIQTAEPYAGGPATRSTRTRGSWSSIGTREPMSRWRS